MIKIFNKKHKYEILIDEGNENVIYTPKLYDEENPHILIELHNINFFKHAENCKDCDSFLKAFGTNSNDWYIDLNGRIERLDLRNFGNKYNNNNAKSIISNFFEGTKLKLKIDTDSVESLMQELIINEENEEYETCAFIRDKINNIKNQ
ncbi:MAG: hypothetical protein ACK4IK_09895 [Bacteroidia bacterium]